MRRSVPVLIAILAALLPRVAEAQTCHYYDSGGVNLRWDHCWGDGGVASRSFACNTNVGSEVLVASFVLTDPLSTVVGMQIYVDLASSSGTWPSWWLIGTSSACRIGALSANVSLDPGDLVCQNLWPATAAGAADLLAGYGGPTTRQMKAIFAVPNGEELNLPAGTEILAMRIRISHAKTLSTCVGCDVPMCLALSEVALYRTNEPNCDHVLKDGAHGESSRLVTWNGAAVASSRTHPIPAEFVYWYTTDMNCVAATPARRAAWGQIKSLYR